MVFGALVRGPLIGTPLTNAGEDIAVLVTGSPVVSKQTGKAPHQTGYDPLKTTWEAVTEWPITSDIVEIGAEVTQVVVDAGEEVVDAVREILEFVGEAATAAANALKDGLEAASWFFEHPYIIVGTVAVVGAIVLYVALK